MSPHRDESSEANLAAIIVIALIILLPLLVIHILSQFVPF